MWLNTIFLILYCASVTLQSCPKLIPPFSQLNCTSQATDEASYYYYLKEEESCVPNCKKFETNYDGVTCTPNDATCPPGYECSAACTRLSYVLACTSDSDCPNVRSKCQGQCIAGDGTCMSYHTSTDDFKDTYWKALNFKPNCDNEGNWEAKQCKGGISGRCMCYNSKGARLFGQALYSEASDMTCACVRRKAELQTYRNYVSLHCDTNGNYEKLQCDSGQCWCVEPKTGDLTSAVVPEKAMKKLPCYIAASVGGQYLRQCESKKYATAVLTKKLQQHGVKYVTSDFLLCDDDGSYGAYSISSGIAYCTWRDNTKIGTWQSDTSTDFTALNCYCARDYKKYSHNQECESYGNYKTIQQVISGSGNYYYCADTDGFSKSPYLTESPTNCSDYY